jgi:hypothetical protein
MVLVSFNLTNGAEERFRTVFAVFLYDSPATKRPGYCAFMTSKPKPH